MPEGGTAENSPIRVYDTSGAWGDPDFHKDPTRDFQLCARSGLDNEMILTHIEGRSIQPIDNGYLSGKHAERSDARTKELPDFDRSKP